MIAAGVVEYLDNKPMLGDKTFKEGDLVLLYDNKFAKFPGRFCMHWLGPYQVKYATNGGVV